MEIPHFIKKINDAEYEMYLDNHMLSSYSVCPSLFELKHIKNLRAKGGMSFYPAYGVWFHDVIQWFYENLEKGFDCEELFVTAARMWTEQEMQRFKETETKRFEKMCSGYEDLVVGGRFPCPAAALSLASQYYQQYYTLDRENWTVLATEAGFGDNKEVSLGGTTITEGVVKFFYTGRPDLVVMDTEGRVFPVDHKTTDRIDSHLMSEYKPHSETAGYIYAIEKILASLLKDKIIDRCVINVSAREVPTQKPRDGGTPAPRFKRIYPMYSQDEIEEWETNTYQKYHEITKLIFGGGRFRWNETQCHNYSGCEFLRIHSVTPSSRETIIGADYVVSAPWKPYEASK